MTDLKTAPVPAVGPVAALSGIARHGFLDQIGELWRRHGDLFRVNLGVGSLTLAIHPDSVKEVNLTRRRSFDKGASYDGVRKYVTGEGLVASTGELWRRQRKLMAPFFTPRGVQAYAEVMLDDTLRTTHRWDELAASGQRVEMGEEMMELTASIIVRSLFGAKVDQDVNRLKGCVETMIGFSLGRNGPHLPDRLPTPAARRYRRARDEVHSYIQGVIDDRRAMADPPTDDLLAKLMAARDDDGQPMSETLLRDESITMFFAGHETTARTMGATWAALAANPDVEARLHAELDEVLGDRTPTVADLHDLPYTLRVVKEVLRLYPAAPFYARDAVEDTEVQGQPVKSGTAVMLSPYYTHRHPDFWEDPERFDPDRFTPEAEKARHPQAYHPFATGERVCIGNSFSLLESHLLLAVLAQRFRPRLSGAQPRFVMGGVLTAKGGLPMRIESRRVDVHA